MLIQPRRRVVPADARGTWRNIAPPQSLRRLAQFVAQHWRGDLPKPIALVESLEPRIMLSAEFGPGLDPGREPLINDPFDAPADDASDHLYAFLRDAADGTVAPAPFGLDALGAALHTNDEAADVRHEIVFVDESVDDYTGLIESLRRGDTGIEIVVLDRDRDGVVQIDAALAGASNIDAIHIISHGNESGLQLGDVWLNGDKLAAYEGTIAGWQQALDPDADIFLYGCNLAGSADGRALIDSIAVLTGADIAASEDLTGAAVLGGDWDLEYATGQVEAGHTLDAFAGSAWVGVLGQITVTTAADTLDGDANTSSLANLALNPGADGEVSLREAIIAANNDAGADVIFLAADTYVITDSATDDTGGDFDIRDDLSIVGISPTASIVDGNNFSSVFDVHDDAAITVTFANLTIQRGFTSVLATEDGAGLYIYGASNTPDVYLSNVRFTGNNTTGFNDEGGAIYNEGRLTIENALIDNNASKRGGGIFNAAGATLSLTNVTLSANETHAIGGQHGGGLYNAGTATILHSTITLNDANADGGGIYRAGGTISIANSIIAGNIDGSDGPDIFGTIASLGSNIIGDTSDAGGFVGSDRQNVDPLLDALADNGGSLMTHAPQATSDAIDNADAAFAPGYDQRALLRDDGAPDIGAHEVLAATSITESALWLSTKDAVFNGGQAGIEDWGDGDLVTIGGPELNLGAGTTSGAFSLAFAGDAFSPGVKINAAHYVSRDLVIGAASFQLLTGDLLFSTGNSNTFTSNNLAALATGFASSVSGQNDDIIIFRPDNAGDYSRGQFGLLIDEMAGGSAQIRGITLIEQQTTVGGTVLEAGDFLYSRSGGADDSSIWLYETNTLGAGSTPDNRLEFLDGDDAGIDIAEKIFGIELIEVPTLAGNATLDSGTILLVLDASDTVGNNNLAVDEFDIFQLDVITSSLAGTGDATARMLFNGSDVAFDSSSEAIVALALAPVNAQPSATNLTQTQTYTEGDVSVALDDIVVTDADAGEVVTATLTLADISAGVLTTSGTATYTAGTGIWTITDTIANVNTALASVSFTPATNNDQDTTIGVSISDGGENGTIAVTGTITLDVIPVNDQIVVTNASQTISYNEDDPSVALNDTFITDVDTGEVVTATLTLADTTAGVLTTSGSATYTAGTGVWAITDTIANVNAALAAASFTPAMNHDQDTTIAVNIADGGENGAVAVTGTITLDVNAVNDQLAATNVTQTQAYTEGDASVALDDIVVTDPDTGETVTATLTLANTATGVLTTSGSATYTAGTGVWTITDTVANVNAALAAVSFTPVGANDVDTTIAVNIADAGENGTVAVTGTITLDVTPVNDQLAATNVTQTQAYNEGDGSVALDDIVVTDADAGETVTATLTLADTSAGVLTTSGSATYTAGTGVWTITDTVANVNTALAAVSFTPATNNDQDTTIAVNIADGGEDGTVAVTGTITLDVTPVNDQLAATNVTQTKAYTEGDASVALDDIVVTDVDTGETITATLTLADISAGVLTTSGSATYTAGTGVWTITDTVANVNTALAAVSFTPAANYDQDTTIAVNIADGGEDGTVAVTGTITLDVTPVNDQLAATNVTQTRVYNEGDASVALDDIVITDVDTGETVTATLTLANTATGSLTTSGSATYTAGTGVWTITDTLVNVNAALAAVSFSPLATNDQDTTIAVSIADAGENGTVAVTGTITLDATSFNTQLSATNTTQTHAYVEGAGSVALDDIIVTDPDVGEIITANLTLSDPNAGALTVSGAAAFDPATGAWTITDTVANVNAALAAVSFTPAATYDLDTSIAISIADGGEFSTTPVTGLITLDVTPINEQTTATNLVQARTYTEDTIAAFDPIVITDNDYLESVTARLTLSDPAAGALSTSGIATFNSATGEWRASGSVASVNAALALVSFNPAANYDENVSVAVLINDGGENGVAALTGTIALAAIPVGDTPLVGNATTPANTPSEPIVVSRNPNDGAEVTHFRISGITNGRLTLADGSTPVNDGDYIPVAAGQAGLRFAPDPDQLANGRFAVEASQDGFTVAAQSAKAQATITITPAVTDAAELAGTAGAFIAENAVSTESATSVESVTEVDSEPAESPPAESSADDEANLLAAAAAEAGMSVTENTLVADDALASTLGSITDEAADGASGQPELRDKNSAATSQTGFVERFMFSASAGLIRTDSYVDADLALMGSDGGARALDALLTDVEFLKELDVVRDDLNDVAAIGQTFVGSSVALSTGISVGYVVWIARGGLLLASLVSSMPAWRLVDPLPILARLEDADAAAGGGDSLASIIEQNDDGPAIVEHTVDPTPAVPDAR